MTVVTLPEKPPCYGQKGRIKCTCGGDKDCLGRRYFWLCAQSIADIQRADDRRMAFTDATKFATPETAKQLYAAYRGLLTQQTEGKQRV